MTLWDDKYPGLWGKVYMSDLHWLSNFIKSHDINQCTDEHGNTLLHHAVNFGLEANMSHVLIDPQIKNAAGQTAFHVSQTLSLQNYHLCIDFAKASSQPNGLDALFAAIYRGDATLGDTSGVTDDGNEKNAGGWTALQCAAMYDRPHLIRALHQRFPKLYPDSGNCPALCIAARYGHSNCIIALCECFPTISPDGALRAACCYNRFACIPILHSCFPQLDSHSFSSALLHAAEYNNPECIRALHSCFPNIDPNAQDGYGKTPLMAAAMYAPSPDCFSVLVECFPNIDPNKQDFGVGPGFLRNTALLHLMRRGLYDWLVLFHSCFPNTDLNVSNMHGKTALMLAIECNHDEKCLIALCKCFPNIDPNIQDNNGNTALIIGACKYNHLSITFVSQLHKLFPNIDPNVQNKYQETALMRMLASKRCPIKSIRQFIHKYPNLDVNIQNVRGQTALTLAIKRGDASIVALLLKRFPDIHLYIDQCSTNSPAGNTTALLLAVEKDQIRVLSALLEHIVNMCKD